MYKSWALNLNFIPLNVHMPKLVILLCKWWDLKEDILEQIMLFLFEIKGEKHKKKHKK